MPDVGDEAAALRAALARLAAGRQRVMVTHSDLTCATPNDRILPVLLAALEDAGVARDDVTLINSLGTHRRQTPAELRQLLAPTSCPLSLPAVRCLEQR